MVCRKAGPLTITYGGKEFLSDCVPVTIYSRHNLERANYGKPQWPTKNKFLGKSIGKCLQWILKSIFEDEPITTTGVGLAAMCSHANFFGNFASVTRKLLHKKKHGKSIRRCNKTQQPFLDRASTTPQAQLKFIDSNVHLTLLAMITLHTNSRNSLNCRWFSFWLKSSSPISPNFNCVF